MVTRLTAHTEREMSGEDALVEMTRDLMAAQARGEMPTIRMSQDGRVTLRWQDGTKVSYLTGVDTGPVPAAAPAAPVTVVRDVTGGEALTVDGIRFDNAGSRDKYLALKGLAEQHLLYLVRSDGHQLKRREDPIYLLVADEDTNPDWVTGVAANLALSKGWIDEVEHADRTR